MDKGNRQKGTAEYYNRHSAGVSCVHRVQKCSSSIEFVFGDGYNTEKKYGFV